MKVGILYWSGTGNTEAMAQLIAQGAADANAEVYMKTVSETTVEEAASCDAFALGCPAMGDEELEEGEFQPFYDSLKPFLAAKPVVLFGSYNWADGEWMRRWQDEARKSGINLIQDGLICYDAPEDSGKTDDCLALGKAVAESKTD